MNLLILGRGKTGSLVAEIAKEHGHQVHTLGSVENENAAALTATALSGIDAVIDFTTPQAVLQNIQACVHAGKNMVIGTTGWYSELARIRKLVDSSNIGLVYASNFSIGMNIFFEIARAASAALQNGYTARIMDRHHAQKEDSPSGTAVTLKNILQAQNKKEIEITSIREGDAAGQHVILLDSAADTIMLVHDAKSRRGFAEGALRAAEWIQGRHGFFEFRQIFAERQQIY